MVSVALSHSLVKPPPGTGPRVSSFRHRDQRLQSRPRESFNSRICPHDFANSQIREFANSQIREFANSPPFTTSSRACQMVGRGAFGARAALREPDSMPHRNSPPHPTYFPPDLRRPPFALPHRPFACGAAPASPWDRTDLSGLVWGGVQPRNQTRSWTGGGLPFFVPPPPAYRKEELGQRGGCGPRPPPLRPAAPPHPTPPPFPNEPSDAPQGTPSPGAPAPEEDGPRSGPNFLLGVASFFFSAANSPWPASEPKTFRGFPP